MSKRITNKQLQIVMGELRAVQEAVGTADPNRNAYNFTRHTVSGREWDGAIDDVVGMLRGVIEKRNAQKRRASQRRRDASKSEREAARQGSLQFEPRLLTHPFERTHENVTTNGEEVSRVG